MFLVFELGNEFLIKLPGYDDRQMVIESTTITVVTLPVSDVVANEPTLNPVGIYAANERGTPVFDPSTLDV